MLEALVVGIFVYFSVGIIVRTLAHFEIIWCVIPATTVAEVLSKRNSEYKKVGGASKATAASGGDVVNILHAVPGHKLVKPSSDYMEWSIEKGFELRGLFYYLYKVQYKGIWWSLAQVRIREFRKAIDDEEAATAKDGAMAGLYRVLIKDYVTKFPYFSREHAVAVTSAETKAGFPLDALLILKYKVRKPSKARLSVADSNAVLASFAIQAFKGLVAVEDTDFYLYGGTDRKQALVDEIKAILNGQAYEAIGLEVTDVILDDIDVDAETRALLELKRKNELEGDAKITEAEKGALASAAAAEGQKKSAILISEGTFEAKMNTNKGEADYNKTVLIPMSENDQRVAVFRAVAYRDNAHITTYAPGDRNAILPLIKSE
jgi:regulator of protease activity HflC (stomatin/prohibitin superfamily)